VKCRRLTWLIVPTRIGDQHVRRRQLDVLMSQAPTCRGASCATRRCARRPHLADRASTIFGMNQTLYPPFRDGGCARRSAISIDREAMSRGLFGGLAEPLYGQITPGVAGYDPATCADPLRSGARAAADGRGGVPRRPRDAPLKIANLA